MKDAITANEDWWELLRHCPQSLVLNRRECPPPITPRVEGGGHAARPSCRTVALRS